MAVERICENEQSCIHTGSALFCYAFGPQFPPLFPPQKGFPPLFPPQKLCQFFKQPQYIVVYFSENENPQFLVFEQIEKKNPGKPKFSGEKLTFLTLGELRCATGGLEAVLFPYGSRYPLRHKALRVCHLSNSLGK